MRTATVGFRRSTPIKSLPKKGPRPPRQSKSCPLCQQAGQPDPNHFLSEYCHVPEEDRKYIAKARQHRQHRDNGYAWIGNSTGRAHVPRPRAPATGGNGRQNRGRPLLCWKRLV